MLAGMSTHNTTDARERILHTDDDLRDLLTMLLERANRRQFWTLFIDDLGRLGDPIMPMADHPDDPFATTAADDLGEVTHARLLMHRIGMLREITGNAATVLVWERLGGEALRDDDRRWARAMAAQARELGVPLRAQFVLHDRGLRQLYPDDYVED